MNRPTSRCRVSKASYRRPRLEALEDRIVLSTFGTLASDFAASYSAEVQAIVNPAWQVERPLIGGALTEIASPVDDVRDAIEDALGGLDDNAAAAEVDDVLTQALENAGFVANVEITPGGNEFDVSNFDVAVELSREESLIEATAPFDIGLPLPIHLIDDPILEGDGQFAIGVGLTGLDLNFGINGGSSYFNADSNGFEISLFADIDTEIDVIVGLLAGQVSVEAQDDFAHPLELALTVNPEGATVDADAHFTFQFLSGVNEAYVDGLPQVGATIAFDYYGSDPEDEVPEVSFEGVNIKFGEVVSRIFTPIVEHLGPVIDKVAAVYDVLQKPIPGLSALIDPDPTVLSILGLTADLGVGDPAYQAAVRFLEASALMVNIADSIDTEDGELVMQLGSFDLSTNGDLRQLDKSDFEPGNLADPDFVSPLSVNPFGLSFDGLADWADENLPEELAGPIGNLVEVLSGPADVSMPLITNPFGVVSSMLVGQSAVLFSVDVHFEGSGGFDTDIPVPGLSFSFDNTIDWVIDIGLGLDTRGIQRFIESVAEESPTTTFFGEGFFIREGSKIQLTAGLVAEFSFNFVVVSSGIDGGVAGTLQVEVTPADDWSGAPGDKLYLRSDDFGPYLGVASGDVSLFVDAWIGFGPKIPFTDEYVFGKEEFHLAKKKLFEFGHIPIPNPFAPPPGETYEPATTTENQTAGDLDPIQDGELWLNIGDRADFRNFLEDHENEFVTVAHVGIGDDGKEIVEVTFAGQAKAYSGIDTIIGDAGDGTDRIEILEGVTSHVILHGGSENDILVSRTSGTSELFGESGEDLLQGGLGHNELWGGIDADELVGGRGTNLLVGSSGDDVIFGGPDADTIHGDDLVSLPAGGNDTIYTGDGPDTVYAGGGNDLIFGHSDDETYVESDANVNVLHGEDGDDTIFAGDNGDTIFGGNGDDDVHAGAGNDQIATYAEGDPSDVGAFNGVHWENGDGAPVVLNSRYSTDTLSFVGGSGPDTFAIAKSDTLGLLATETEISAEAPDGQTVIASNVNRISIDGRDEADTITIHSLAYNPTRIIPPEIVAINLTEEFRDEGEEDHIYVLGTPEQDEVVVDSESVIYELDEKGRAARWGGVMTAEFPTYKVFATNFADDFQVSTFDGKDAVTVNGATGPTLIDAGNDDDEVNVNARTLGHLTLPHIEPIPRDFTPDTVTIEAGTGINTLRVYESYSEIPDAIHIHDDRIESILIPHLSYRATGGKFHKVEVAGGPYQDKLYVHSTHADASQTIVSGFFDPAFPGDGAPDEIFVANSDDDLSEIRNTLQIAGQSNPTSVHVRDRGAASGNSAVTVVGDQIAGFAGASDEAVIETVNGTLAVHLYGSDDPTVLESFHLDSPTYPTVVHGGQGDESMQVVSLLEPATLRGEEGNDSYYVGDALGDLAATLTIDDGKGVNEIRFNDSKGFATIYELNDNGLDLPATPHTEIVLGGTVGTLEMTASPNGDQFRAFGAPPGLASIDVDLSGGPNVLRGPDEDTQWIVTGPNEVTITGIGNFAGAHNVLGGSAQDDFVVNPLGDISDNVIGGGGDDVLDYSAWSTEVIVDLALGTATAVGGLALQVEKVFGGKGDDFIFGNNANNFLKGNGGNDVIVGSGSKDHIFGGDGRDVIIGGAGADLLRGDGGEDLVIGGSTVHDGNPIALAAIRDEWTRPDLSYKERVFNLRNGGGLNGLVVLDAGTVIDDLDKDVLFGKADLDWCWAGVIDQIVDAEIGEQKN